ncbi:MAG: endopeptidase La, partial [Clostridia bacterium]|nr:endopeptidase La [Clostridia bacterium]
VSFGDNPMTPVTLDEAAVRGYLGLARYEHLRQDRKDSVGTVTGLAWTEFGGETMDIEAVLMPTKGGLKLTGNLGKVMRESAMTAYSYIKSHAEQYGLDLALFEREMHIHATEGAVPKDGPSAGCALAVVMLSALSGRKVRCDRALTGEISLTGRVLPIGGVKEKSLGALRDGIATILVPQANIKDVEELNDAIKSKANYIYVSDVDTVIKEMLR